MLIRTNPEKWIANPKMNNKLNNQANRKLKNKISKESKANKGNISNERKILLLLFKNTLELFNSRVLAAKIGISHVGVFKIMKKLEEKDIVVSRMIGKARVYSINNRNPIARKEVELALMLESQNNLRWLEEFKDLKNIAESAILFGSILRNEKEARDIDLLIISEEKNFSAIKKFIESKNNVLNKKIHPIIQTKEDFNKDFMNKNKVTLEIIKTGVILFGQENINNLLN